MRHTHRMSLLRLVQRMNYKYRMSLLRLVQCMNCEYRISALPGLVYELSVQNVSALPGAVYELWVQNVSALPGTVYELWVQNLSAPPGVVYELWVQNLCSAWCSVWIVSTESLCSSWCSIWIVSTESLCSTWCSVYIMSTEYLCSTWCSVLIVSTESLFCLVQCITGAKKSNFFFSQITVHHGDGNRKASNWCTPNETLLLNAQSAVKVTSRCNKSSNQKYESLSMTCEVFIFCGKCQWAIWPPGSIINEPSGALNASWLRDDIVWSDTNTFTTHLTENKRQNAQNKNVLPVKKKKCMLLL